MPNIGPLEIGIILVIVLVIFGTRRLPEMGRSLGTGLREFKDGITGGHDDEDVGSTTKMLSDGRTDEASRPSVDVAGKPHA